MKKKLIIKNKKRIQINIILYKDKDIQRIIGKGNIMFNF